MNENEDKNSSPSPKKESSLSFPRVKVETPEHREKRHLREQKELVYREKQLAKPPKSPREMPSFEFYCQFYCDSVFVRNHRHNQLVLL